MNELYDLYETKKYLEDKIDDFFGGDTIYSGDRGYQDLLERLDEINSEIDELENKEQNN